MQIELVVISIGIMVVALSIGFIQWRQRTRPVTAALAGRRRMATWLRAGILFLAEAAGVAASIYITRSLVTPEKNALVLSIIIACANFGGSLAARGSKTPLKPEDVFVFFKDGLLWPAALPALAQTLSGSPS